MTEEQQDKWSQDPAAPAGPEGGVKWERQVVEKLVFSSINEARRARRWGIFFKLLTFAYLFVLLVLWFPKDIRESPMKKGGHTALIEVAGVIAPETKAGADNIVTGLRDAFEDKDTKGVILRINSPGGSPVQAGYIRDEIKRLKAQHPNIPVYAVITDICASGGYYVAAAADEIYADKASIVGSIGVLMNGFGFVEAMEKLGVERRLLTAGEHKGIMDPFSPVPESERRHVQGLLDRIHQQFIGVVKEGRGERLKDDPDLFSGLFWSGEEGVELGLVDGLGSSSYVARELIGAENIVDFTPTENVFERLAERMGAGAASTLARISGFDRGPRLQ